MSRIVKAKSNRICSGSDDPNQAQPQSELASLQSDLERSKALIMEEVIRRSRRIYEEAEVRAEETVALAYEEGRAIRKEAERQGFDEGYGAGLKAGVDQVRKEAEETLSELASLMAILEQERRMEVERRQEELLDIAFEVAKKIMKQQLETNEDALLHLLEEVLSEGETEVKIHLAEYSRALEAPLERGLAKRLRKRAKNVKVIVSQREDLILAELAGGVVDLSIPVQLAQLREAVSEE